MDKAEEGEEAVGASHDEVTEDQTTTQSNVQMGRIVKGETILNSDESVREDIPIGINEKGGASTELSFEQRDSFIKGEVDLILTDEAGRGVRVNRNSFAPKQLEEYFGL